MNHLIDFPAGFVKAQMKHHRRTRTEVSMPDAHERQGILKACVFNLDADLGLYQLGSIILTVFDGRYTIHLDREITPDLHKCHTRTGVANDKIVVEFEIRSLGSQMRAGVFGGSRS